MARPFPARLHVVLAPGVHRAVIFRRGPSRHVCTIGWDLERDRFTVGQWLNGRIYERRADLSPDGKHLIYFAMNDRWKSKTRGSWTAISRAPYLKALVLLSKGDCWHGGGLFTGPRRYWLNDGYGHQPLASSSEVTRDVGFRPSQSFGGECPNVYYPRLLRHGWRLVDQIVASRTEACTVFDKPLRGGWILRKLAHEQVGAPPGKGCYWDEHELEHDATGTLVRCRDWE